MTIEQEIKELSETYQQFKDRFHGGKHSLAIFAEWKRRQKYRAELIDRQWDMITRQSPLLCMSIREQICAVKKSIKNKNRPQKHAISV